ncbi:MAG: hypothetical protein F6K21_31765 [Symploca sp. SIO2D2]|nr:hypothetical protein [Symploca sp. SIO2D2]
MGLGKEAGGRRQGAGGRRQGAEGRRQEAGGRRQEVLEVEGNKQSEETYSAFLFPVACCLLPFPE